MLQALCEVFKCMFVPLIHVTTSLLIQCHFASQCYDYSHELSINNGLQHHMMPTYGNELKIVKNKET